MEEVRGRLRIGVVAPPMVAVPPKGYAGTERMIAALVDALHDRGHAVTLYAAGDSDVPCDLVPIVDRSLWSTGHTGDIAPYMAAAAERIWVDHERFDVIHSHLEAYGFLLARHCPTPVVSTLHGRLDVAGMPALLDEFREIPLVSISDNQRRWWPDNNWLGTVYHGLPLADIPVRERPGQYLALVGRLAREKGVEEAIETARRTGRRLRIAAKVREPSERQMYEELVRPAEDAGIVEFLGELEQAERDQLYAGAFATLMLGAWPEPFGIVAIESLATGTPVIARKTGALPEIVEHGVDGFIVDDEIEAELALQRVLTLDRAELRRRAIERFSVERMTDEYEAVSRRLVAGGVRHAAVVPAVAARAPEPVGAVAGRGADWPVGMGGERLVPGMDPDLLDVLAPAATDAGGSNGSPRLVTGRGLAARRAAGRTRSRARGLGRTSRP